MGKKMKLDPSYKQLDISEVLYLIIQQIGFMPLEYWTNLDSNDKALFPQYPLIENIARKGKKSKLFDNDGSDNIKYGKQQKIVEQKENDTVSSEEDAGMQWNLFSDKLKNHRGNTWNLIKHYGSALIEKYHLHKMEECMRKMVKWDPLLRITP